MPADCTPIPAVFGFRSRDSGLFLRVLGLTFARFGSLVVHFRSEVRAFWSLGARSRSAIAQK